MIHMHDGDQLPTVRNYSSKTHFLPPAKSAEFDHQIWGAFTRLF